MCMLVVINTFY